MLLQSAKPSKPICLLPSWNTIKYILSFRTAAENKPPYLAEFERQLSASAEIPIVCRANGSGKSTLYDHLRRQKAIRTEIYVSADRIEADIKRTGLFAFNAYRVPVSEAEFQKKIQESTLLSKRWKREYAKSVTVRAGRLHVARSKSNSYLASVIADYLVQKLFSSRESFCFETVMSHPSKVQLLKKARSHGFRTYLYYLFTDNPLLNQYRVVLRAKMGGHSVPAGKIEERYYRSLGLLKEALRHTDCAYLINNSSKFETVAEKSGNQFVWKVKPIPMTLVNYAGFRR